MFKKAVHNIIQKMCPQYVVLRRFNVDSNLVGLTFDDGPHLKNTGKVLELLKRFQFSATFFCLGSQMRRYPKTCQTIVSSGCELGNHSYSHKWISEMNRKQAHKEMDVADKIMNRACGQIPQWIRIPYGEINFCYLYYAFRTRRLPIIQWNHFIPDEEYKSPKELIYYWEKMEIKAGDIILLHDVYPNTCNALPYMLSNLRQKGLKGGCISELYLSSPSISK